MAYCRKPLKALTTCPPANVFSRIDSLDRVYIARENRTPYREYFQSKQDLLQEVGAIP